MKVRMQKWRGGCWNGEKILQWEVRMPTEVMEQLSPVLTKL